MIINFIICQKFETEDKLIKCHANYSEFVAPNPDKFDFKNHFV